MKKYIILSVLFILLLAASVGISVTITKGLIGKQDLSLWNGTSTKTFTRTTEDSYTLTLNQFDWVGVDVLQKFGGGVSRTDTTITSAKGTVGSSNDVALWFSPGTWTITDDLTITSNITMVLPPGTVFSITAGKTLTINGPFKSGLYQVFSGSGSVAFGNFVKKVYPEWWGENTTPGTTDMTAEIQAAIDSVGDDAITYFSPTSYLISDVIDVDQGSNVSLIGESGAEIILSVADKDGFNITQNNVTVRNLTMEGEGTYVTSGSSGKSLIVTSGDHTIIRDCYLKEPEQRGIEITGDYAVIEDNVIEGGDYFADAGAIGSDRQHYGIYLASGADYAKITGNKIIPNSDANAGVVIQGITNSSYAQDARVQNNYVKNAWDHGIYLVVENSVISQNVVVGCGIKTGMRVSGTSVKGNVISGNSVDVNDLTRPLAGDDGIILINPKWTVVINNTVRRTADSGIAVSCASPYVVSHNSIVGNVIDNVRDGAGSDSAGIGIDDSNITIFAHNVISGNVISDIGDDTDGTQAAIYINVADNANHIGNVITGNTIDTSQENGIYAKHLTGSIIGNNIFYDVGQGAASAAIEVDDLQRSRVEGNITYGDGSTLSYGYTETNSDYNIIDGNTFYNPATAMIKTSEFGSNSSARNNSLGNGDISVDSTADARSILYGDLNKSVHLRDPNGASRTDTTDTAANINAQLLFNDGASFEIIYINTGGAGETITIAGGSNVTIYNNEGAADLVIPAQSGARLIFIRDSSTTVRVFGTVFEAA